MKTILTFLLAFLSFSEFAQTDKAKPIVAEGKLLYRSEMASWYGTDLFLENYKDRSNIGGYFSYTKQNTSACVFFSKSDTPVVIGTISFDSTYNTKTAKIDLTERAFTADENDIYIIRKKALAEIASDTSLFRTYKNMQFNLVPLISKKEKKVYVLTGPQQNGIVVFGNDYLLLFDKHNKLQVKKQLHKNILPVYFGKKEDGKKEEGAMHTHLPETGDFITSTDICTLMLYEKFTTWKTYHVVSEKYLNIWDCDNNELTVIPMDVVKKITEDQKK